MAARLVLAPDRDNNGIKYIANIDRDFPSQIEGYYLAGTPGLWRNPQGGMDISDNIRDCQLTKERVLELLLISEKACCSLFKSCSGESSTSIISLRAVSIALINSSNLI